MKILIVGNRGMLGNEFMNQLNNSENEVIGWDKAEMDITDKSQVLQKISKVKPDLIINCAAYNAVDNAEDDPSVANLINGEAVGYLSNAARDNGAIFVHFSSDYVFDGIDGEYREDAVPTPISKYGESKLLGERNLVGNYYLVRTSRLFGTPGPSEMSKKSFPAMMLGFAREKGKIQAIDAEIGSPTYVNDLAGAVMEIVESKKPFGIYHITNNGICTWYEYAKATVEYAGVDAIVEPVGADHFPRKAKRPAKAIILNTKHSPLRPWQEALREFIKGA